MTTSIVDRLRAGTVLGAEGYVFELERRGYIKAGPFVPEVVLDYPDAVRELHREFLRAGADVMVALTYYAHREKLRDVGREGAAVQAVCDAMETSAVSGRWVKISEVTSDVRKSWEGDLWPGG